MADYVHGLTSGMNVVEAMPAIRHVIPYWGEGSLSIAPHTLAQNERGIYDLQRLNQVEHRDIASRGMDDNVHAAAAGSNVVEAIPQGRQSYSYNNNGWLNTAQVAANPEQKKDIRNTNEVRPDVWHVVHDSISSTPLPRPKEAPAAKPEWAEYKPAKGLPEEKPKAKEEAKDEDELKAAAKEKAAATAAKIKSDKAAEDAADDADAAKGSKPSKKAAADEDAKDDKKKDDKKDAGEEEKKEESKEEKKDDAKADAKADAKEEKKDAAPAKEEAKADAPAKEEAKADAPAKFAQKTAVVQKKEVKVEAKPAAKPDAKPAAKPAEKKPEAKEAKKEEKPPKKSFLMMEDDEEAKKPVAPEKVHILEPHEYKEKADTNIPNIRTTFYDKKNGVWRQGDQM